MDNNLKISPKSAVKMLSAVLPVNEIVLVNADVLPIEQVAQVTIQTIGEELASLADLKKRIAELPKVNDVSQVAEMAEWQDVAKLLVKLRTASTKKIDSAKRVYLETDRQMVKIRNTVEAVFQTLEEEARQNGEFLKRIQDAEADAEAQRRLDALAKFGHHAKSFKEVRGMDADVFEAFLADTERKYIKQQEEEKAQKEAQERAEKEKQLQLRNANRLRLVEPYSAYFVGDSSQMEEMEFEAALASAKQAKSEADAVAEKARKEKDALRNARFSQIASYASFARYAGDLAEMPEDAFSELVANAKLAKEADDLAKTEKIRIEAEARAKQEAEAKAQAEKAAAEKAKAEEAERLAREAKAKADALAKAGDGEKLKHFASALLEALKQAPNSLETEEASKQLLSLVAKIGDFNKYVNEKY